uniref:Uncharacterized protein n=1 Tax=Oryza glumipatula TaxID=40148 RepID=A0A0D9Y988_9ORYZ
MMRNCGLLVQSTVRIEVVRQLDIWIAEEADSDRIRGVHWGRRWVRGVRLSQLDKAATAGRATLYGKIPGQKGSMRLAGAVAGELARGGGGCVAEGWQRPGGRRAAGEGQQRACGGGSAAAGVQMRVGGSQADGRGAAADNRTRARMGGEEADGGRRSSRALLRVFDGGRRTWARVADDGSSCYRETSRSGFSNGGDDPGGGKMGQA